MLHHLPSSHSERTTCRFPSLHPGVYHKACCYGGCLVYSWSIKVSWEPNQFQSNETEVGGASKCQILYLVQMLNFAAKDKYS